jgi:hypothetical protein
MTYVIYNPANSNRIVRVKGNGAGVMKDAKYKTERAAKAGLTRMKKEYIQRSLEGKRIPHDLEGLESFTICSIEEYRQLNTMVERTNFMTGEKYMEDINTPRSCSPSTELYWSM